MLRLSVIPRAEFMPSSYAGLRLVRRFHRWDAWSGRRNGRLFLILEEYIRLRVTLCEFDDPQEYAQDRRVLETLPGLPGQTRV